MEKFIFGRNPRGFNPLIPHFSALQFGAAALTFPPSLDYSNRMPDDFGIMLNDNLKDCVCAAFYHARQIWSFNSGKSAITDTPDNVLRLYEKASGYDRNVSGSDKGDSMQHVLHYLFTNGAPVGPEGSTAVDCINGYIEVDPRNTDDIKRTIFECGVAMVGFVAPHTWLGPDGKINNVPKAPTPWDFTKGQTKSDEKHAVILVGYNDIGYVAISWGHRYTMTYKFFEEFGDEAYAVADQLWFDATGLTPLGMNLDKLNQLMKALERKIVWKYSDNDKDKFMQDVIDTIMRITKRSDITPKTTFGSLGWDSETIITFGRGLEGQLADDQSTITSVPSDSNYAACSTVEDIVNLLWPRFEKTPEDL